MSESVETTTPAPQSDLTNNIDIGSLYTAIPNIQIHIRGTNHSGKSRLAAKIAKLIEEEVGYPYTFISGDGDFTSNYFRVNGEEASIKDMLPDIPMDMVINRGPLDLKPVAITIIDDNSPPLADDKLQRHCRIYYVKPK